MVRWTVGWLDVGWMDGQMDKWMVGWMDKWMIGWMDNSMTEHIHFMPLVFDFLLLEPRGILIDFP